MRFGVNYTPASGWFHSWLDFSPSDVARDLEQIATLGVDHVRIFPLWPLVQPNRSLIRASALDDVARVVDIAAEFGLDVNVDALQGHLSSFDFVPSWLESWHRRNMFTDSAVVESTARYVQTLASALTGRPNLLGITIGNELNQFAHSPHPTPHVIDSDQGHQWLDRMIQAARTGLGPDWAPLVTASQYEAAWYDDAQPFGPEHAAEHGDLTITHSWVFNGATKVDGPLGSASVRHGEFLLQLAAAWNLRADRSNWLQEVGAPTNVVPPGDAPDFVEQTMLHALGVQELFGITWWCSHDVSRKLADFPELEYDLGLISNDGRRKPTGQRFAEVIQDSLRTSPEAVPPSEALVLEDTDADGQPVNDFRAHCAPGGRFSQAWLARAGQRRQGPQVVLRSRITDRKMLESRGIHTLLPVATDAPAVSISSIHPAAMS